MKKTKGQINNRIKKLINKKKMRQEKYIADVLVPMNLERIEQWQKFPGSVHFPLVSYPEFNYQGKRRFIQFLIKK